MYWIKMGERRHSFIIARGYSKDKNRWLWPMIAVFVNTAFLVNNCNIFSLPNERVICKCFYTAKH